MSKSPKSERPKVLLVVRAIILNKENKILLIKRAANDSWNSDRWEIPGGKLDAGQDISNALEREVFEETGLLVIPTNRLAYYESKIVPEGKYKGLPYISLVGIARAQGEKVKLSNEHQDFAWVSLDDIEKYNVIPKTHHLPRGNLKTNLKS